MAEQLSFAGAMQRFRSWLDSAAPQRTVTP